MTKLRTLRSRLLLWISAPLLALWVMSTMIDHDVASGFVNLNYDRALLDTALDLGRNVREANNQLYLDLPQPVIEMLISGEQGRFYYRANGPVGEYITGDPDLPNPPEEAKEGRVTYYDAMYRNEPIRAVALRVPVRPGSGKGSIIVQVAEKTSLRDDFARQIMLQEQQAAARYAPAPAPPPHHAHHHHAAPPAPGMYAPAGGGHHGGSVTQVMCPTCLSLNNLQPDKLHLDHMCGTCHRVLPNRRDQLANSRGADLPSAPTQAGRVRCQYCNADNVLPPGPPGQQFMCGHCRKIIAAPTPPTPHVPPPPPPGVAPDSVTMLQASGPPAHAVPPGQQVLQGTVMPPPQVQVRCGQCPAINQIPRQSGEVHFKCGQCGAINRAVV